MEMIRTILEDAAGSPLLFLLYAVLFFAVVVLIGGVIVYWAACTINKRTAMTGLMRVSVTLNQWPDDAQNSQSTMLNVGSYLVGMQDPKQITRDRLDRKLQWLEAAKCRKYRVSALLDRFRIAFDSAGFAGDPVSSLLGRLLDNEGFCAELGEVSRRSAKRGLRAHTSAARRKEGKSQDKLSIFYEIPKIAAESLENELRCDVKMLRVTLEYSDR